MRIEAVLIGLALLAYSCDQTEPGMSGKGTSGSETGQMNTDANMLKMGRQFHSEPLNKTAALSYISGLIEEENYASALIIMNELAEYYLGI